RGTTSALTTSPQLASALSYTPASSTCGWLSSAASTSAGLTFSPPLTIVSALRPPTDSLPCPSSAPTSPVCSQPSAATAPAAIVGPRARISPSGAILTFVQNSGGPAVSSPSSCAPCAASATGVVVTCELASLRPYVSDTGTPAACARR